MIILALAICSLLKLNIIATVIFTVVFSVCADGIFIYCKMKFSPWDDERELIGRCIRKVKEAGMRFFRLFVRKSQADNVLQRSYR